MKPLPFGQPRPPIVKISPKDHEEKGSTTSGKDIKNLNNFFGHKATTTTNNKKPSIPSVPVLTHANNSSENLRPVVQKNINAFDDYYEKNSKFCPVIKQKKDEVSLSGDSYQSEGYVPIKKIYKNNAKSIADKLPSQSKNLVSIPLQNNQEPRVGFKSPNLKPANRS